MKSHGFRDTGRFIRQPAHSGVFTPSSKAQLLRCLDSQANMALPIRPRGAGTSVTDCNSADDGTVINMVALNQITNVDLNNYTVTAQAGVRLGQLIAALADQGLELIGNFDQTERTIGGAIASPCMGPGIGDAASYFADQVLAMKVVTSSGKMMLVTDAKRHLLSAFRHSYGVLGVIYEATIRVRPISNFVASHRSMDIDTFAGISDRLARGNVGLKFYMLPYRNHVYLDLRHYESDTSSAYNAPWKIKDWGESTILPGVFKSLGRVLPIPSMRYQLIDSITTVTHDLVNSRLVRHGNNATATGRPARRKARSLLHSTWCFPACDFSLVVKAYARFCRQTFAQSAYRCDLPAVGFRVAKSHASLLAPSFDEASIALQTVSTQRKGWDNFALDLADFAENWGGTSTLNQTLATRAEQVAQTYGGRIDFFRKIRSQLDPDQRLLNPYLSRYLT